MKLFIAAAIIAFGGYLSIEENIVKNPVLKDIVEKLLLFIVILCSIFNLVLIKFSIYNFKIEIGLLSILLLVYIYLFSIMHKKEFKKKRKDKKITVMLICFTVINLYIFLEPLFLYIYSTEAYSLYLFTYLNLEFLLITFLFLKRFQYKEKTIIFIISCFSILNSGLAFFQYSTGRLLINFKDPSQQITQLYVGRRVSGFVIGDNGGGNLGVILFPILLYNYSKNKNVLNLMLLLSDLLFTVFTFTRIAYLSIIVELIIYFISTLKIGSIKNTIKKITSLIFAIGIVIYFYLNYFNELINILFSQRGDTQNDRFAQFPIALNAFYSTPIFGTGHGQYNDYVMCKFGIFDNLVIHSQLLNILVEEGIVFFILFIIINILLIYMLLKKYNKKIEVVFLIMLFVGNLICINFNPNQTYEINIYIYYFILFGFLFSKQEDAC